MRKYYNKLVRDGIVRRCRDDGLEAKIRTLTGEELRNVLRVKLVEEVAEVIGAPTLTSLLEELADLAEVLYTLGRHYGISEKSIDHQRRIKIRDKGPFDNGEYLEYVEYPD